MSSCLVRLHSLFVYGEPNGGEGSVTKLANGLISAIVECIPKMRWMKGPRMVALNPFGWVTELVESPLGAYLWCIYRRHRWVRAHVNGKRRHGDAMMRGRARNDYGVCCTYREPKLD